MNFKSIIGTSPKLKTVLDQAAVVSPRDVTVLILGESGVGKEVLARAIHDNSPRKDKPFVAVNCMALSKGIIESELFGHEKGAFTGASSVRTGRFESAHEGTLFLDEIGELSHDIQVKLLRVIQERCFEKVGGTFTVNVDVRLITATNVDLHAAVQQKNFRDDLYYRLNTFTLHLPPLRERGNDILLLADHFISMERIQSKSPVKTLSKEARKIFLEYVWPGNIRELRNAIQYAFVLESEEEIQPKNLPAALTEEAKAVHLTIEDRSPFTHYPKKLDLARKVFEREFCEQALKRCKGNKIKAAKETAISLREFTKALTK